MVAAASSHGGHGGHGGGGHGSNYKYGYIQKEECPAVINVNLALSYVGATLAAGAAILYFQEWN
jgi:hypothetical protein